MVYYVKTRQISNIIHNFTINCVLNPNRCSGIILLNIDKQKGTRLDENV